MKHRFESFGGIVASDDPPLLAFVDRQMMRELGLGESELWRAGDDDIGLLSAPTEVHLAATDACTGGCPHCYMASGSASADEMDTPTFERALAALAEWGVFHVALGGGEALLREDIFHLARYARRVGLVPNLTVSGAVLDERLAARMTVFGQVNVSLDGVGARAGVFRGPQQARRAVRAVGLLLEAGVPTGINCVVGRSNFDGLGDLFAAATGMGVNEVELLRLKPVGRAASGYEEERTTYEQNTRLVPWITELSERHGVTAKVDCSFVPMICYHRPPREVLETTATYGCEAANVLLGVRADGRVAGCSFLPAGNLDVFDAPARWRDDPELERLRAWPERAPGPCRRCDYLDICKGGCRAVAAAVCGDPDAPDPDCPFVVEAGGAS
jgi:radical SAM protein with 4Fe4S-binding SPASM domain